MASTELLGNGVGYIYLTEPDGTSIAETINNNGIGERKAKLAAAQSYNEARNKIAYGTVEVTASGTGYNVTAININSVNQIGANVATTATTAALATALGAAVNSFTPSSGPDYTAVVNASTITLYATEATGSSSNGHTVATSASDASITFTDTNVDFGGDPDTLYDSVTGYRIFLYASADAAVGDLTGATEITTELIPQGLNGAMVRQASTISSGEINFTRSSMITYVKVDTESSASTDDLDTINSEGFTLGDMIVLQGENSGRVVTVKDASNNIQLNSGDFDTATLDASLILMLGRQTSTSALNWFEVSRSVQSTPSIANYRTSTLPVVSTEGEGSIALTASGGVTTLTVNTDNVWQNVTGSATLTTNVDIQFSTTGAIAGDKFIVQYDATMTVSGKTVTIGGIALSDNQALTGGWIVRGYYDGTAWNSIIYPNMNTASNEPQVEGDHILDGSVTVEKVETVLATDVVIVDVSMDAAGETGDYKIEWPYTGTVNKFYGSVTKLIEATDDGQVCIKNAASATVSTLAFTAGTAVGTAVTDSPTSNNTFVAGDVWTFTTSKTTVGGKVKVSVKVTKT